MVAQCRAATRPWATTLALGDLFGMAKLLFFQHPRGHVFRTAGAARFAALSYRMDAWVAGNLGRQALYRALMATPLAQVAWPLHLASVGSTRRLGQGRNGNGSGLPCGCCLCTDFGPARAMRMSPARFIRIAHSRSVLRRSPVLKRARPCRHSGLADAPPGFGQEEVVAAVRRRLVSR